MRKTLSVIAAMLLAGSLAFAQGPQGGAPAGGQRPQFDPSRLQQMQDMMDPEKIGIRQAQRLVEPLQLSSEQYDKIVKLYQKEAETRINMMRNSMAGMMGGGMMMGGGPGMMMGGGMGGMDISAIAGNIQGMISRGMNMMQEDEKDVAKRNKKIQKILSAEQYEKFLEIQEQEKIEREQMMQQMQNRPRGQRPSQQGNQ